MRGIINDNTAEKDVTSKTSVDENAKDVFVLLLTCNASGEYLKHLINELELLTYPSTTL